MPSFLEPRRAGLAAAGVAALAVSAWADLPRRAQDAAAGTPLERVFFRSVALPAGPVEARRSPTETRAALGQAIAAAPGEAELYALRAREAERALDFIAAEADWRAHAERAEDPADGQIALAEFFLRRLRAAEAVAALVEAGRAPSPTADRYLPEPEQRSWKAFQRAAEAIETFRLPADTRAVLDRAWIGRYPDRREPYANALDAHLAQGRAEQAEALVAEYAAVFPDDESFALEARARIAASSGGAAAGLAAFEQSLRPDWPPTLFDRYFAALDEGGLLRARLDETNQALAADPRSTRAAAWLFHYRRRQGDLASAAAALDAFRAAHEAPSAAWSAEALGLLARLYRQANRADDAARALHGLYVLPGADGAAREEALGGLIGLLLDSPERPIRFGSKDFSFYRDIATLDPHPGFLNGLLSLLFNEQGLGWRASTQEQAWGAYSRRASAAELLDRFDREFPASARRPALHARVVEAFGLYGADEAVVARGQRFLTSFPGATERPEVSLRMAEAYARLGRIDEELAVYDALLAELAARADGAPLGPGAVADDIGMGRPGARAALPPARSPEYARVLDRAVARLAALGRPAEAGRLFAREIARNPDDPGLYERLASFLEVNGVAAGVEQVYRQAMARFPERTWHHKLARWYLRRQRTAEFETLTREVVASFSGTELEAYLRGSLAAGGFDEQLYLRVNRYAHERFPRNLTFVRNLLAAYQNPRTPDAAAWQALLRANWLHADDLRARYLQFLVRNGRLEGEVAALETSSPEARAGDWNAWARTNPAAALALAEAEAWRCHYEAAAPGLLALAAEAPTDAPLAPRAAAIHRSLAYADPLAGDIAVALYEGLANEQPADRARWAAVGDALADRGLLDLARPYWERMADSAPGRAESYLDAATVFWDYFVFEDALRLLAEGRRALGRATLYAFEAGAIHEGRDDSDAAIAEYLQGALAGEGDFQCRNRLIRLAARPAYRETIEQATARLVAGRTPAPAAVRLRAALLEDQRRTDELGELLTRLAGDAESFDLLAEIDRLASARGLRAARVGALERRIALTRDPVTQTALRLDLARLHESHENFAAAEAALAALAAERPRILGVVRARADYYQRRKQPREAAGVLVAAAAVAYPELAERFEFEAATTLAEAADYSRAEALLDGLLARKPFAARYTATRADLFARQRQDAALRDFYRAKLEAIQAADLPAAEKSAATAALRRGLIPALDRLGDAAGAVDQYVEAINLAPEDRALVEEAALYAGRHEGQRARLEAFYVRTTEQSPRDVRFHRVLAWLREAAEDYPGAAEGYARALTVRPDSVDLRRSRAELLERLLRFDEAAGEYEKLYEATYRDPLWMEKIAEAKARRGDVAGAAASIRAALVDGRPERPENYFAAARRLEDWGLVEAAERTVREGLIAAGPRLWRDYELDAGLRQQARLLTRLRRFAEIRSLMPAAPDDAFPYRWQSVLGESVAAADRYLAPAERARYVAFLDELRAGADPALFAFGMLPALAQGAFADVEARWLHEALLAEPMGDGAHQRRARLVEVQSRRVAHAELGRQLETQWQAHPARRQEPNILTEAAEAYRAAGDAEGEFRALAAGGGFGQAAERYFELLLARDPNALVALAGGADRERAREAANYAVAAGDAALARRAVEAFGRRLPPVWMPAHLGLAGLHHSDRSEGPARAFDAALGEAPIGERVGVAVDRTRHLAGDVWYEYASRYGVYLSAFGDPAEADAYLPAAVESVPGRASAYFELGDVYRAASRADAAAAEYRRTLELNPDDARAHDRLGELAADAGRRSEAIEHWGRALETYAQRAERYRFGPTFWDDIAALIGRVGGQGAFDELREPLDRFFSSYVRRNGVYRLDRILRAWLQSANLAEAEFARSLALANESMAPVDHLALLAEAAWLETAQRVRAHDAAVERAAADWAAAPPESNYYQRDTLDRRAIARLEFLLASRQPARAAGRLAEGGEAQRDTLADRNPALLLRIEAHAGRLDEVFAWYEARGWGPEDEALREAAVELRREGAESEARSLLETYYRRHLEARDFAPANFLGLAELRLEAEDWAGANELVERMTRVAGGPFEHHSAAAGLYLRFDRTAEAARLLDQRARAMPWDTEARVRLAAAELRTAADPEPWRIALVTAARDPRAAYVARVQAARALGLAGGRADDLGDPELNAIAAGPDVSPDDASGTPGWFHARRFAAKAPGLAAESKTNLLAEALALRDDADLRWDLAMAFGQAESYERQIAVLAPLLARTPLGYWLRQPASIYDEDSTERQADDWMTEQILAALPFESGRKPVVASSLGMALLQTGRFAAAELLFDLALRIEPDPVSTMARGAARAQREARAENARRRPVLNDHLEQPNPVQPRLEVRR